MEEGTGYKLVMGFIIVTVCLVLWLPLNDAAEEVGAVFNNMTTGNATYDAEMIERNNTVLAVFANVPLFLLLVYGLWVIKSAMAERKEVYQ